VVFPRADEQAGEYVNVLIERVNSATLFGRRVRGNEFENSGWRKMESEVIA